MTITVLSFSTSILYANLGTVAQSNKEILLTSFSDLHFPFSPSETHVWITYVVISVYFLILPLWVMLVLRNRYTRQVLKTGWIPVLSALFISG